MNKVTVMLAPLLLLNLPLLDKLHPPTQVELPPLPPQPPCLIHTSQAASAADWMQFGEGRPQAIIQSPDGNQLAVVTQTGLQIYDAHDISRPVKVKRVFTDIVTAAAWSPTENIIAIAIGYRRLDILDGSTLETLITVADSAQIATRMGWSHDGSYLALGGANPTVAIYETATWRKFGEMDHDNEVVALAWSPIENTLTIAEEYAAIEFIFSEWQPEASDHFPEISRSDLRLSDLEWSADGSQLAVGSGSGIAIVDEETLKTLVRDAKNIFEYGQGNIAAVSWSPDAASVAFGSGRNGNILKILNVVDGKVKPFSTKEGVMITDVRWSADGQSIFAIATDDVLRQWDAETTAVLHEVQISWGTPRGIQWSPDDAYLAISYVNDEVNTASMHLLDAASGETRILTENLDSTGVFTSWSVIWSPDGQRLALNSNGLIQIITQEGTVVTRLQDDEIYSPIVWSPDGQSLATIESYDEPEPRIRIWDTSNGELRQSIAVTGLISDSLAQWPSEGLTWATQNDQDRIQIWRLTADSQLNTIETDIPAPVSFQLSQNADLLLGRNSTSFEVWDVATQQRLQLLEVGEVRYYDWSSDGQCLAFVPHTLPGSGRRDEIYSWHTTTDRAPVFFNFQTYGVNGLEWSQQSDQLVVVLENGLITIIR